MSEPFLSNRAKKLISAIILLFLLIIVLVVSIIHINRKAHKADELVSQGDIKYEEMEYEQAELKYKEAIALRPDNISAYLGLEKTYLANGDLYSAVSALEAGYKKTEDSLILAELEHIKGTSSDEAEVNRSVLSVDKANVTDDRYESTLITAESVRESPGVTQTNSAVIPDVDSNTVKAVIEAAKENNAGNDEDKSDSDDAQKEKDAQENDSNQADNVNTTDTENVQENSEENSSNSFVKVNINETEYSVSFNQWKRWYNLWKIDCLKNNLGYLFEDSIENEWEIWYQALEAAATKIDGKLIAALIEENSWSNLLEFWRWLSENL